jgi:uncharacterized protein YwgA
MDRYQLVKLVEWAGEIDGRKRMQKVVFLLISAGCPIDADYLLHHYGPYSADVAQLTDVLVQLGLLIESANPTQVGQRFSYFLAPESDKVISAFESTDEGAQAMAKIAPYRERAQSLFNHSVAELEYAATIAYFHKKGAGWDEAVERTCEFKRLSRSSSITQAAFDLAKSTIDS